MKKDFFILLTIQIVFILALGVFFYSLEGEIEQDNFPSNVWELGDRSVTIIELEDYELEYIFNPKDTPNFKTISEENSCKYAINGSYFSGSALDATHSGRLNILGEYTMKAVPDRQLTHIYRYNSQTGKSLIIEESEYENIHDEDLIEFQSGPLVLKDNQIQLNFINNSLNGRTEHIRTLIGIDKENKIYLVNVITEKTLEDLANLLLEDQRFFDRNIELLNLDGGSSVAIYSSEFPYINFNTNKNLPLVLCFR